jgi:hypothetical protein
MAGQVLLAEGLEIAKGVDRFKSGPGDIKPQIPLHDLAAAPFALRKAGSVFTTVFRMILRGIFPLLLSEPSCRLRPISTLSEARDASLNLSCLKMRVMVASSAENSARSAAIWPSSTARLYSSANCCRSASSFRLTCSARLRASCATRYLGLGPMAARSEEITRKDGRLAEIPQVLLRKSDIGRLCDNSVYWKVYFLH